ncbi:unnamed protein product [Mytilus coruscus]|uniref:Chromo domain-containing protein n=1 Tax=Mytilus coruscus TaxID=42192 RepID=A0A6J8BCK2_MYTCO|nr:unnamed protein product [Mytilus coruscus]
MEVDCKRIHYYIQWKDYGIAHVHAAKRLTPKRIRLLSSQKYSPPSILPNDNKATRRSEEDDDTPILNDFKTAIKNLEEHNLATDFLSFIKLVKEDNCKFPFDSISLLLFLETVRFMSKRITSGMWNWQTKKRFCKTGYSLEDWPFRAQTSFCNVSNTFSSTHRI